MSNKVRIVGDKWPPASNTYAQIDCTKSINDNLDDLASQLAVEKSVLESESVYCRAIEGGKMGPPIKMDEPLEMVAKKPILYIRKKPAAGASPVAKPGMKVPPKPGVKTVPPPPPGTKAVAPKTAVGAPPPPSGAPGAPPPKSPMKKAMILAKAPVKVPPKPTAKPAAAASVAADTTVDDDKGSNNEGGGGDDKKDDDDFDPSSKFGGGVTSPSPKNNDSDDDGGHHGHGGGGGGDKDSDADDDHKSESHQQQTKPEPTPDDSRSSSNVPVTTAPPKAVVPPPPPPAAKKVLPKKTTPPPSASEAPAENTATSAILATHGNSNGMDNVAATLAAQRSVDDRLLQLQKSLVDEEKKRIEQYEVNLRHALAAEVDSIKTQLNSSMQEERARSMQVQAVLEEQRTQLLRALAERDTQLQLAQGALQEAVQLGGKQAGPALAAIRNGSPGSSSSTTELAKEMQSQNDQLKKLLAAKDTDAKNTKNTNRAELDAMIKAQTHLVKSIDQLHNSTTSAPSAAIEDSRKDLTSFLANVGLSRFTAILQKQDIDLEILAAMNDDELAKAGVDTVGARKRILLENMKSKKTQQAHHQLQLFSAAAPGNNNNVMQQQASRELFANGGGGGGASPLLSPTSKKSVTFGQNTSVPPPPPPSSGGAAAASASSSPPALAIRQQAQQDAQQASIQAAQLSSALQDHHRVLHQLFRRAGAADWLSRSAEMVESFKDSLPALYEAVSSKLGVPAANYQQGTGASALKQFVARRFPHLIPAIDVMVFLADGREAEFADTMMLRQLKIGPQRLVWFCVPVAAEKAPEFAEDTSDGKEKLYFYSALSKMSQWKRPTLFPDDKPVPKVQVMGRPLDDAIPKQGEKLSPNPPASRIGAHRATDQQFIAATLSLLMRKDPSRLSQFPEFCRAYERRVEGEQGGKINYKGMYLDALQSYGPDDD